MHGKAGRRLSFPPRSTMLRVPMAATNGSCSLCGGTGWKPVGPEGSGRGVVRCDCMAQASFARRWRAARIPARYQHCDFASFETSIHSEPAWNKSLSEARLQAEAFVREFLPGRTEFGLLFMGPSGVGKTHLAVAILRALVVEKGVAGLFYDFRDLLKEIQSSWNPISQSSETEVLRPVLLAELLVLDDMGAGKPSEWVKETLAHIINQRYNDKRATIFTSNFMDAYDTTHPSEDTLEERIGTRLRSRLFEMCKVVIVQGEDYRRTAKQAGYQF